MISLYPEVRPQQPISQHLPAMDYVCDILSTSLVWGHAPWGSHITKGIMGAFQMFSCCKSLLLKCRGCGRHRILGFQMVLLKSSSPWMVSQFQPSGKFLTVAGDYLKHTIIYFSHTQQKSTPGRKRLFLAYSLRAQPIIAGESQQQNMLVTKQNYVAAGHMVSTVQRQRGMGADKQLTLYVFTFIQSGMPTVP